MTYAVIEAGAATVVKLASGYTTSNVSRGERLQLGAGVTKAAIIYRGAGAQSRPVTLGNPRTFENIWVVDVEVMIPNAGRSPDDMETALQTEVDLLLAKFAAYPALSGVSGVMDVSASASGESIPSGEWWSTVLNVRVTEYASVSQSE